MSRKISWLFATLLILGLSLTALPARAASIDLGTAGEYNLFILSNLAITGNQESGRVAAGGDAKLRSYTVGTEVTDSSGDTLVVGGKVSSNIDPVATGNVVAGGKVNVPGWVDSGHIQENSSSLPVDFIYESQYLGNLSNELASLATTGQSYSQYGGMYTVGDGTSEVQVFDVSGDDLSNATWWQSLSSIPDDAWIIFNVSGTDIDLTGGQWALVDWSDKIIFNLYQAQTLSINNITVQGSILAPYADVTASGATVAANLVAKSLDGSLATLGQNFAAYDGGGGVTPGAAAPEPGTLMLMGSALFGTAGILRRRRKAAKTA
ncbi:MAG: choice-of-anchor A family protein [Deltaproteobacteria bacterium]|nr:choice-of-anchor A family protein [Deltaproteobacteria bacterium]